MTTPGIRPKPTFLRGKKSTTNPIGETKGETAVPALGKPVKNLGCRRFFSSLLAFPGVPCIEIPVEDNPERDIKSNAE